MHDISEHALGTSTQRARHDGSSAEPHQALYSSLAMVAVTDINIVRIGIAHEKEN